MLFLSSLLVIALAMFGMAIGVIIGRRPIGGSCGGLAAMQGGCEICAPDRSGGPPAARAGPA